MKAKFASKNTTKIIDLKTELGLNDADFSSILREVNIRLEDRQKNLDQNEVGRIRRYLNEKKRRAELKGQTISLPPIVKISDFAEALELPVGEALSVLLKNGVMATLNDSIDYETAAIIAEDLGYQTEESAEKLEEEVLTPEMLDEILKKEDPDKQAVRPPVVTIMGHVDHGKTTLLDAIRSENVAAGEAGGITQAISGYQVTHNGRDITFIDTPGHETFEFMRKRGASLADIAILVVAADDGVKPQTKEAVKYAREAGVPILVAINKVDKAGANLDKVKTELSEIDLQPEEWGGKTVMVAVSALKKEGIEDLLEMILLATDVEPPQAIAGRAALGSVLESHLDKHLGPVATIIVHTGTVKKGDNVVIGSTSGRVRRLMDYRGKSMNAAGPSVPATIIGLDGVPEAGQIMQVVEEREQARAKASQQRGLIKTLHKADDGDERQTLAVVLKADTKGSIEAVRQTIEAMTPNEVRLSIVRAEVGNVSDSDVLTAQAAGAIIYAFNASIGGMAKKLAEKEHVPVKSYKVIYELTEDVRSELEQRLPVDVVRTDMGTLKVLKVFFSTQGRKIIGGEVAEGKVTADCKATIWRKEGKERLEIGTGTLSGMQKERQEVAQAQAGDQIGLTYEGKGKIKEGDILEIYKEEDVRRGSVT